MKIAEIFTSIQGESTYAGCPCTFVRFSGCNLRCTYCDTTYAYSEGVELSEADIINEVSLVGVNLVEITGGEPLMQEGAYHLIEHLLNDGYSVLVETNGTMSIKEIDPRAVVILDIKTPKSGMSEEMDLMNLDYLKPKDEVKFVILDKDDYVWAKKFISRHRLKDKCKVLFSPAFEFLIPETLSAWILQDRLDVRLNLQMHKYIFGAKRQ
ncbi:MAG: radical SAM protein [Nitrospirae bacterium]|nr:radical SAM protein [Nitrospirota bacterium]